MLKCIRIRTCTKKKLKYNLKLFKFRKASQVLFSCQENAIISGLWVISQGGRKERDKAATGPSPERGASALPSPPRCSWEQGKILGEQCWQTARRQLGPSTPNTSPSSQRQQRTPSWKLPLPGRPTAPSTGAQVPDVTSPRAPN